MDKKMTRREFLRKAALAGASAPIALAALEATGKPAAAKGFGVPHFQKPVTIKLAHYFDPLQSPAQKFNAAWMYSTVGKFEQENPNIKVEPELFQWDQIDNRSILDFQAGIKHDVMFGSPQLMAKHFAVGDYLDLTPYLASWSKEEIEDFSWSPVWAGAGSEGKQIAVQTGTHTRAVGYRRDMFKAAGLDPDKPPTTWEECLEAAKALTKGDVWGLGMYFGPSRATIELYFAPFIWHFGGELWDSKEKKATFASEAGIKAAKVLYDLVYTDKVTPEAAVGGTYDDHILVAFLNNRLGMGWGFGSYWIVALENGGFIKGCFPATDKCTVDTGSVFVTPTVPKAQFTNAWTISIHALSDYPDESFKLLEFILRPENLYEFPDAGLPARLSLWERPEFQTPFYQTWLEAAKNGKPMPPTVYYPELADTCAACLQEILVQKAPIEETLKKFEDEWNAKYAGA
ncbi:MAG: ABC transporter substrate-binding protein [Anaerolineae bacterium]